MSFIDIHNVNMNVCIGNWPSWKRNIYLTWNCWRSARYYKHPCFACLLCNNVNSVISVLLVFFYIYTYSLGENFNLEKFIRLFYCLLLLLLFRIQINKKKKKIQLIELQWYKTTIMVIINQLICKSPERTAQHLIGLKSWQSVVLQW